ncbi:asr0780 [Nostoc sp. PCC 7120 = FACHB-418]|nr:asr0780 [Nostoc sp. PCC 7120 = FACHB-418]
MVYLKAEYLYFRLLNFGFPTVALESFMVNKFANFSNKSVIQSGNFQTNKSQG